MALLLLLLLALLLLGERAKGPKRAVGAKIIERRRRAPAALGAKGVLRPRALLLRHGAQKAASKVGDAVHKIKKGQQPQ